METTQLRRRNHTRVTTATKRHDEQTRRTDLYTEAYHSNIGKQDDTDVNIWWREFIQFISSFK